MTAERAAAMAPTIGEGMNVHSGQGTSRPHASARMGGAAFSVQGSERTMNVVGGVCGLHGLWWKGRQSLLSVVPPEWLLVRGQAACTAS